MTKKNTKTRASGKYNLTIKQKRFCDEYLKDLNGTQSAIRAGYSKNTAESQASTLLRNPKVAEYIRKRMDERAERTEVTQDQVLRRWAQIGLANIKDYITWDSNGIVQMKSSDDLTHDQTAAISEIIQVTSDKGNTFRFKMKDDQKATDSIAKHLGMLNDKLVHSGSIEVVKRDYSKG